MAVARTVTEYDIAPVARPQCGTYGGWGLHIKAGERRCRPCLDAANAYKRARRYAQNPRWRNTARTGTGWV